MHLDQVCKHVQNQGDQMANETQIACRATLTQRGFKVVSLKASFHGFYRFVGVVHRLQILAYFLSSFIVLS